jgi:hypothetical protein
MKFHNTDDGQVLSNERMRYVFLTLLVTLAGAAADSKYRTFSVGDDGELHLLRTDRKEEVVRKDQGQLSFGKVAISPDRRLVGWFAFYLNPFPSAQSEVPQALVIFQDGIVLRRFTTQQMLWDWAFRKGGSQVAYCDGPPGRDAEQCLLRDMESSKILERWNPKSTGATPKWAVGLHF